MKKILIIEDDKVIAGAYKQRFGEAGYHVELAPDGLEGIKLVTAGKPDVVLLDLLMPRLDGIEVLKFIRSHPEVKHLPVVVFSNSYMTNLVESAWRAGADQCLMKASTTPTQLFDAVNNAIAKAASRKPAAGGTPAAARPSPPTSLPNYAASPYVPPVSPRAPVSPPPPAPAPVPPAPAPLTAPPPATPGPDRTGGAGHIRAQADPEFQAQIRQLFLSTSTTKLGSIRALATSFVQGDGAIPQSTLLSELFRKIHSLTGNAALAGCQSIADFACTFEALLQELIQQPAFVNVSTRRTVARAVDFVELQFRSSAKLEGAPAAEPVLVVEKDPSAVQNIRQHLAQADLKTEASVEAAEALGLMASQPFSLVVLPAELPAMSGFELLAQMQSLPGHRHTPALFLTGFENYSTHAAPEILGDNDLIAKPYLPIELILRSLMGAHRGRLA